MRHVRWLAYLIGALALAAAPVAAGPRQARAEGLSTVLVTPCRYLDTREGSGAHELESGQPRRYWVTGGGFTGSCGVPVGASGVIFTVTVTGGTAPGHLVLWAVADPGPYSPPSTSIINWTTGQTVATQATVGIASVVANPATVGEMEALATVGIDPTGHAGKVHLILDIVGYLQ